MSDVDERQILQKYWAWLNVVMVQCLHPFVFQQYNSFFLHTVLKTTPAVSSLQRSKTLTKSFNMNIISTKILKHINLEVSFRFASISRKTWWEHYFVQLCGQGILTKTQFPCDDIHFWNAYDFRMRQNKICQILYLQKIVSIIYTWITWRQEMIVISNCKALHSKWLTVCSVTAGRYVYSRC